VSDADWRDALPAVRGTLRRDVPLALLTWLRVGGPAEVVFQPADAEDLAAFLAALPPDVAVTPVGVASNLLVRDGGIAGVVVRFGGPLAAVEVEGEGVVAAGPGALDQRVAQAAQRAGRAGLEFMIGIPGTVGGAVRMNAGAFGGETGARVAWVEALDRQGRPRRTEPGAIAFAYRRSSVPADWIVTRAGFRTEPGDPAGIAARMEAIRAEREAAQPLRVATGGSTFKNPDGHKAWRLIDAAGCRGLRLGGAMVSEKHCNFLINTGGASAADVEGLGELVRRRVREASGVELEWEIHRVGRPLQAATLEAAA
jgi:UDP-N-acetylmuramate dehydrogenase